MTSHSKLKRKALNSSYEEIDATIQTDARRSDTYPGKSSFKCDQVFSTEEEGITQCKSEGNQLKFEVSDEGPGIPPDEQPRLFSKFQRLSNRPTGAEISTGLGLSIVKELTNQLGGEISFKTESGKGTVFILTLPKGW